MEKTNRTATSDKPVTMAETGTTVLILLLSAGAALLGLFRPGHYDEAAGFLPALVAQDFVILAVAVPVLAVGLWLARRNSLRGYFVWTGGLAYMTYTWASQSVVLSFNAFFLGYIALFALSGFTLSSAVVKFDAARVARTLEGSISTRLYGGFLGITAVALSALWLSEIIPATLAGTVPPTVTEFGQATKNTYVLDLGIVVPSLAIAAWWLWRERDWGYVFAGVLVTMAAVLAPAITGMTIALLTGGLAISGPILVGSIVPPLVGVAVATRFILAIPRGTRVAGGVNGP